MDPVGWRQVVLIETLWNVNIGKDATGYEILTVLIETLWNVNRFSGNGLYNSSCVLIETLWNVNESHFR